MQWTEATRPPKKSTYDRSEIMCVILHRLRCKLVRRVLSKYSVDRKVKIQFFLVKQRYHLYSNYPFLVAICARYFDKRPIELSSFLFSIHCEAINKHKCPDIENSMVDIYIYQWYDRDLQRHFLSTIVWH